MDKKIIKEKEFHNNRFSEEVRESAWKYYSIEEKLKKYFDSKIFELFKNKKILEIGCGKGDFSIKMARNDIHVVGIDISDVAIEYIRNLSEQINLGNKTEFYVMNAEELDFSDSYFDGVIGISILHHLELLKINEKLASILKGNGIGIFKEPLGHNPFINLYRKLTPSYRTEDEHPLLREDLLIFNKYFENVEIKYFHLTTLIAVPFRKTIFFSFLVNMLSKLDELLFKFSLFKYMAWQVVIIVSNPRKKVK